MLDTALPLTSKWERSEDEDPDLVELSDSQEFNGLSHVKISLLIISNQLYKYIVSK